MPETGIRGIVMYLVDAIERNEQDKDRYEEPPKVSPPKCIRSFTPKFLG